MAEGQPAVEPAHREVLGEVWRAARDKGCGDRLLKRRGWGLLDHLDERGASATEDRDRHSRRLPAAVDQAGFDVRCALARPEHVRAYLEGVDGERRDEGHLHDTQRQVTGFHRAHGPQS